MKLIAKDNFNRETISDILIVEGISEFWASEIKVALNKRYGEQSSIFIDAVPRHLQIIQVRTMNAPDLDQIIRAVQEFVGVNPDGVAGLITWKAIYTKLTGKDWNAEVKP